MCIESAGDCLDSTLLEAGVLGEDDGFSLNPSFSMEEEEEKEAHPYQMQNGHHQQNLHASTPDLISMFSLPSSLLPNPSIFFSNTYPESSSFLSSLGLSGDPSTVVCDPSMFPLSHPPQPPLLRELFHSLPQGAYGFGGSSSSSLLDEVDERDQVLNNGAFYQDVNGRAFGNGVFEFSADMNGLGKNRDGKDSKHFATEKQRRVHFNDKFQALRKLIPNPTKNDRASILGDAIEYINELKSTVTKLKVLVEKKRCSRERINKRQKTTEGGSTDYVKSEEDMVQSYNGISSRSNSWHHRKSKNTEVDVRIIDDEVTVKLVQHKGTNCLLLVSKVLDELQLDLYHVAGGLIGDYYSFLFNSKIFEGTTVYASAIANMLIEAAEKQYSTQPLHLQAVTNENSDSLEADIYKTRSD